MSKNKFPPRPKYDPDTGPVYLYGLHTVRAALDNPRRKIVRMLVTRNVAERLELGDLAALPFPAELVEPRDIEKLTGSEASGDNAWQEFWSWLTGLDTVHGTTLLVGSLALAVLFGLRAVAPQVPGALVVVLGGLLASALFNLGDNGVALVGDVPRGLPGRDPESWRGRERHTPTTGRTVAAWKVADGDEPRISLPQVQGLPVYKPLFQALAAYDMNTGEKLWEIRLPSSIEATPITYMGADGRQYVAVVSTGGGLTGSEVTNDEIITFALPIN